MAWWRRIAHLGRRTKGGAAIVLPEGGRSSIEPAATLGEVAGDLLAISSGQMPYDPRLLEALEVQSTFNPTVSQAVKLLTGTANTGHDLVIEGPVGQVERAQELIGGLAPRLYRAGAGADGLISHYLRQLVVTGALSSEDVLTPDLAGVHEVALIPPRQIRFRWDDGEWAAFQRASRLGLTNQEVRLNPTTFAYLAIRTEDGYPPYGIPPFAAAIQALGVEKDILKDLASAAHNSGLMGVNQVKVPTPEKRYDETEAQYQARVTALMQAHELGYRKALGHRGSGWLISPNDHELVHHNISAAASQVKQLYMLSLQLLMSSLGIDPAMFGWSMSTTETYAGVVFNLMVRESKQYQRVVKRRMERTYGLHLLLGGVAAEVSLKWKGQPDLKPQEAAQAEKIRAEVVWGNLERGLIGPDRAAQELGYDEVYAPDLAGQAGAGSQVKRAGRMRLVLSFDRATGAYQPPRLAVLAKLDGDDEAAERAAQAEADQWVQRYRQELAPLAAGIRERVADAVADLLAESRVLDQAEFGRVVMQALEEGYATGWATDEALATVKRAVEPMYRHYRLVSDLATGEKLAWTWGGPEVRVLNFSSQLDQFFLSKFITNQDAQAKALAFLREQYLEKGSGLFGRSDPNMLKAFRNALGEELAGLDERQIQRIVDTGVQRLRAWAAVQQLQEAGVVYAEIWAILDQRTSAICREMHGRVIKVADAVAEIDRLSGLSPAAFAAQLAPLDPRLVRLQGSAGQLLPPYHPHCRSLVKMALEAPPAPSEPPEGLNQEQERAWEYWHSLPAKAQAARVAAARDALTELLPADLAGDAEQVLREAGELHVKVLQTGNLRLGLASGQAEAWRLDEVDMDWPGAPAVLELMGAAARPGLAGAGWLRVE